MRSKVPPIYLCLTFNYHFQLHLFPVFLYGRNLIKFLLLFEKKIPIFVPRTIYAVLQNIYDQYFNK
jgi:hypothetical protein